MTSESQRNDQIDRLIQEDSMNFRRCIRLSPDPVMIFSQGRIVFVNDSFLKETGYQSAEDLIGTDINRFVYDAKDLQNMERLYSGEMFTGQFTQTIRKDGIWIDVTYSGIPIQYDGLPAGLIIARNISEQTSMNHTLVQTQEQFNSILSSLDAGFWSYHVSEDRMMTFSGILSKLFSASMSDGRFHTLYELWEMCSSNKKITYEQFRHSILSEEAKAIEFSYPNSDGSDAHHMMRISVIKDEAGNPVRLNGVVINFTEQTEASRMAHFLAYHDELSALPNRRYFNQQLKDTLNLSKRNGRMVALIYLDLDRFKYINDSLGHSAGDLLLKEVADRLAAVKNDCNGFISRLGGDEFTIILSDFSDQQELERQVRQIQEYFQEPVVMEGYPFYVKASLGVAVSPLHASTPESLMNCADTAMFLAKESRNTYRFYSDIASRKNLEDIRLQYDLQHALSGGQLSIYYQPKYDVKSHHIVGSEALLRWNHPELGMISPARFIPLAEDSGLINEIGEWILESVCDQIAAWQQNGIYHCVSVNLSVRQFQNGNLVDVVRNALQASEIKTNLLELEITESIAMDIDKVLGTLIELNRLGVIISIDDFGTGYSSLSYLSKLPVHKLKIDRSFIRDLMSDQSDAAIVSTIVSLAHNMQLKVIAEGVESEEQLKMLDNYRCDEVQGYYFSKPLPLSEFELMLEPANKYAFYERVNNPDAKLKGQFCKFVIRSLIAGDKKFPEYQKRIEEMLDDEWYSWDLYTDMLQDISMRVTEHALKNAGRAIVKHGRKFFVEELGYRSLEDLLIGYREVFDGAISGLPEHERAKVMHYEIGRFVVHYTVRQPLKFSEGVVCGFFEMFDTEVKNIESRRADEHYYEFTFTW
ncbi:EAL domain-containing protein [Paenibacillus chartarius]|uniref:EAL domain-containing protein n=1 Tax=Paenibacillus chartarius TaxID=747481 RepID=A0ABV6DLY7_9BACL